MKEVLAIIRMNMVSLTKEALLRDGFPSVTCNKVLGRGKKEVSFSVIEEAFLEDSSLTKNQAEEVSEIHRLIPKRMLTILVKDEDVDKVVKIIINVNKTGNPGDGKIFVSNVNEVLRVRTGETGEAAI